MQKFYIQIPKVYFKTQKLDFEMQKLDFETQKLDLPAFKRNDGDQNYFEKESLEIEGCQERRP